MRLRWVILFITALVLLLTGISLYTRYLADRLLRQQTALVHLYAEALRYAAQAPEECLAEFFWEYVFPDRQAGSRLFLVPLVLVNEKGRVLSHNLHEILGAGPPVSDLQSALPLLHADTLTYPPVKVEFVPGRYLWIYYGEPLLLRQLRWMPVLSSVLILIVALVWGGLLYMAHRYNQGRLWVGLARETAHQLGTPLSGLVGAVDLVEEDPTLLEKLLPRMKGDLKRLSEIADRFSKIGAQPQLRLEPLVPLVAEVVEYFRERFANRAVWRFIPPTPSDVKVPCNATLLRWTLENLLRNSLDALPPEGGTITVRLTARPREVWIDVEDTGKGIPPTEWEAIFRPGVSTKARGWGIGLSLARRVVEVYHGGEIFVHRSGLGQGTVIRIRLPLEGPQPIWKRTWRNAMGRLHRLGRLFSFVLRQGWRFFRTFA